MQRLGGDDMDSDARLETGPSVAMIIKKNESMLNRLEAIFGS